MTREENICQSCAHSKVCKFNDGESSEYCNQHLAISALRPVSREQVEKVWRGGWERIIDPYGKLEGFICKCGTQTYSASNFCPHCGGAKTDEAVEMVMERLETIR